MSMCLIMGKCAFTGYIRHKNGERTLNKIKKGIIVLLHIGLLLGCLGVVLVMSDLAGGRKHEVQEDQNQAWKEERNVEPEEPKMNDEERKLKDSENQKMTDLERAKAERQEWLDAYHKWRLENQKRYGQEESSMVQDEEEIYVPPTLMLASDLHYMSSTTHDDGIAFQYLLENDDGKVSQYSDVIVDALVEEAVRSKPSALLLTGDITLNGELENHLKLAEKLRRVQEAGVQVLVIPGNHDIQNQNAATYFGTERKEAEYLKSGEAFYEIYREFGFDQAISRDEDSLSYLYGLDEKHWLLLLDSCQYEDYNHVNGKIQLGTLTWMEEQLSQAKERGIHVTVAAHHNLLSESRLYTTECTLENHQQVIELLERYEVPLYISGHLHAQRIKKHQREPGTDPDSYGIYEIVLSPYALPPCQYGLLAWDEKDHMVFETKKAPVEDYSEFLKTTIRNQVKKNISGVPDDLKEQMANLYAELYFDYCAGNRISLDMVDTTKAYKLWERVAPDSRYMAEMGQMIADVRDAMHGWSWLSGPGIETQKEEDGVSVQRE